MCGQSLRESGEMRKSIKEYNEVIVKRPNHVKVCTHVCIELHGFISRA